MTAANAPQPKRVWVVHRTVGLDARIHTDAYPRSNRNRRLSDADIRLDGVRVLVVDDQADARHLPRTLIEQRGGHVIDAAGASAAMASLASTSPHVLIADLAMPDVDGFGLIASVRQRHPHVPGIALTAHARPEDRERAIDAGYSVHFARPFDILALVTSIRDLAASRPSPAA